MTAVKTWFSLVGIFLLGLVPLAPTVAARESQETLVDGAITVEASNPYVVSYYVAVWVTSARLEAEFEVRSPPEASVRVSVYGSQAYQGFAAGNDTTPLATLPAGSSGRGQWELPRGDGVYLVFEVERASARVEATATVTVTAPDYTPPEEDSGIIRIPAPGAGLTLLLLAGIAWARAARGRAGQPKP